MVEVFRSNKEKKDPLDTAVKLTSIGTSIAGLASKTPDAPKTETETGLNAGTTNYGDAMNRRLQKLKTSYA